VTARVYLWVCESSDQGTLGWPPTVLK